jgi:hypothetical protein
MIRRISALLGIAALLAILALLVWELHQHRIRTDGEVTVIEALYRSSSCDMTSL